MAGGYVRFRIGVVRAPVAPTARVAAARAASDSFRVQTASQRALTMLIAIIPSLSSSLPTILEAAVEGDEEPLENKTKNR